MTRTARNISLLTSTLGAIILLGTLVAGVSPLAREVSAGGASHSQGSTLPTTGITHVEISTGDADLEVHFDDVTEASLRTSPDGYAWWMMDRSGSTLRVSKTGEFGGVCFVWCAADEAALTLPRELEGEVSARLEVLSGRMDVGGDYSDLEIEVAAGDFTYIGATPSLDVEVGAGTVGVNVTDAREATFEVAAGLLEATLDGRAPERVSAEVFAGEFDLTVPDVTYRVNTDVAFGNFDNRLNTSPAADHVIDLEVAAGQVTLRPAGSTH